MTLSAELLALLHRLLFCGKLPARHNGGVAKADLNRAKTLRREEGIPNLLRHVDIQTVHGLPSAAINAFPTDTAEELLW